MKVQTFLPIFGGFYGTIYDPDELISEQVVKEGIDSVLRGAEINPDDYDSDLMAQYLYDEFDYENYKKDVCFSLVAQQENDLRGLGLIDRMSFVEIQSPRYYNFSNDSCIVDVDICEPYLKNLKDYIEKNREAFNEYIKDNYTSYDGFMSFYSNDPDEWLCENWWEDEHKLGSAFRFVLMLEHDGSPEMEYYEHLEVSPESYIDLSLIFPELIRNRERYEVPTNNLSGVVTEVDRDVLIGLLREAPVHAKVRVTTDDSATLSAGIKDVFYRGTEGHSTVYINI